MRQNLIKCVITLGLLFFSVFFPMPLLNNVLVASASEYSETQPDIKLNVKSKSLVKDSKYHLKIYNLSDNHKATFKSDSSSIVSVDDKGEITAVDFGTTTITVTVKEGTKTVATLTCDVTVGPAAMTVKLTKSEITLTVGRKTTLTAIVKPANTVEEARFSSNDSTIASVSAGGRITARSVGVTYIFASIENGKYDLCKVTVVEEHPDASQNSGETN